MASFLRCVPKINGTRASRSKVGSFWSKEMTHRHQFDTGAALERETIQTVGVIEQIYRCVQLLDADIVAEELRCKTSDRADPAYPVLARTLAVRRDNLLKTIHELNNRLKEKTGQRFAKVS
jgi:hypothetical protein